MKTLGILLTLGMATSALAQHGKPQFSSGGRVDNMNKIRPMSGISRQDRQFLKDAAGANWLEISSSELALGRSTGGWAKHFAHDMITDHKAALAELMQLAHRKKVMLPDTAPAMVERKVGMLARYRGPRFDAAYKTLQIAAHKETATKLEQEIRNGHDAQVRDFAVKMLPVVRMHLRMAQMGGTITHRM